MSSIFDGVAGMLGDVFGAPVTYQPKSGAAVVVQSIFREEPITITGEQGQDVLIEAPSWRVPRDLLSGVKRGDQIALADGRVFQVLAQIGTGSPASDAFVLYELEPVS
ncbi:hypothetical protein SAMN05877809_10710 [Rhodobacter sp. JA431]|uniref:head-tail joining protein n=1 Tax=Rhodobacter sp. JA431 TaxID=570013 RepID=UPI000BDAD970|nr:hypothetical protein [Rhodobacter sp. JA431]SOC13758.1 hypothetical protein SAMN05877809_10710 [Rhodobacter sp. JA431]